MPYSIRRIWLLAYTLAKPRAFERKIKFTRSMEPTLFWRGKSMNVPKIFIIIVIIFVLINLIGWLTKPDNYKPPENYRGSLSPMQSYARVMDERHILALAANRQIKS